MVTCIRTASSSCRDPRPTQARRFAGQSGLWGAWLPYSRLGYALSDSCLFLFVSSWFVPSNTGGKPEPLRSDGRGRLGTTQKAVRLWSIACLEQVKLLLGKSLLILVHVFLARAFEYGRGTETPSICWPQQAAHRAGCCPLLFTTVPVEGIGICGASAGKGE